jgi:hypothetical protein
MLDVLATFILFHLFVFFVAPGWTGMTWGDLIGRFMARFKAEYDKATSNPER